MTPTTTLPIAQNTAPPSADPAPARADRAPTESADLLSFVGVFQSVLSGRAASLAQQLPQRAPRRAVTLEDRAQEASPNEPPRAASPSLASIARAELSAPPSSQSAKPAEPREQERTPASSDSRTPQQDVAPRQRPSAAASGTSARATSAAQAAQVSSSTTRPAGAPTAPAASAAGKPPQITPAHSPSTSPHSQLGAARTPVARTLLLPSAVGTSGSRAVAIAERILAPKQEVSAPSKPAQARLTPESEHAFAAQLQRGLAAALNQNGGTVHIRLQPEALGNLRIRMDLHEGQVSATFHVDSARASALVDQQLASLRDALETRGLRVASLSVRSEAHESTRPRAEARNQTPRTPDTSRPSAGTPLAISVDADRRGGAGTGSGFSRNDTRAEHGTMPSKLAQSLGSRSDPATPGGAHQLGTRTLRLDAIA